MELRFLKGHWGFGKLKLQYRQFSKDMSPCWTPWTDVPVETERVEPLTASEDVARRKGEMMPKGEWCKHIYWNDNKSGCGFGGPPNTWVLKYPSKGTGYTEQALCELAKFCPICGAPRPVEKSLEEKFLDWMTVRREPFLSFAETSKALADIATEHFKVES